MRFFAVPCALRLRVTGDFALVAMEEWASLIGPRKKGSRGQENCFGVPREKSANINAQKPHA
ncbi:MAG TPA: hypothetical protein VK913_09840, partial [Erythrobacter sp.]|nr:hypothetical protein [Erythrobacter sp.]